MKYLVSMFDLSSEQIKQIFSISADLKKKFRLGERPPLLARQTMALLFQKPSLRTRVSFEIAMTHLGGASFFLGEEVGWGKRESVEDFCGTLSEYVDVVVCRARAHHQIVELAQHCTCFVINGLTDYEHPCQALADLFTIQEVFGSVQGNKLAYIGDANNVARSLAVCCAVLNVPMTIAGPPGYQFDDGFINRLAKAYPHYLLQQTTDAVEAVQGAMAVYTDVWASMGQEKQRQERVQDFAAYQVNAQLMSLAAPGARFLHCLPARRGEEVTDEVIDGPQSAVRRQAGNRMHVQKGLLAWMLGGSGERTNQDA